MGHHVASRALAILLLVAAGCRGESITYVHDDPSCKPAVCEINMSTVITETAADADFDTGLTVPANGEAPSIWSLVIEAALQELADRSQWQKAMTIPSLVVPVRLDAFRNESSRFGVTPGGNAGGLNWTQTSIASAGRLHFELSGLPVGRQITAVRARWGNAASAAIASTKPAVSLYKQDIAVGTSFLDGVDDDGTLVGSQTDPTSSLGTYQVLHDIDLTGLSQVISADESYSVRFTGEASTNAATGGALVGIWITLAY